jgi:hypothetical protein
MEDPPIPIAIPNAAIKKETGKTTLIAAIAIEPIHCPTNIVSIKIFNDMTNMPIEAGKACLNKSFEIGSVPRIDELFLFI